MFRVSFVDLNKVELIGGDAASGCGSSPNTHNSDSENGDGDFVRRLAAGVDTGSSPRGGATSGALPDDA